MSLEHLKNSPLVEAALEIRFPGEPAIQSHLDEFFQFIREKYPVLWVPNAEYGVAPALQPWEFRDVKSQRTVAASINSFIFRVRDYVDYMDFRTNAVLLARRFSEIFNIEKTTHFGLRYVNNIAVLRLPEEPLRIENYLNLKVSMPTVLGSERLEDIHLRSSTCINDLQMVLDLHHQQGLVGTPETLLLVLDCALEGGVGMSGLETTMDRVHSCIEDSFQALAADSYMRYLRGDTL